MKIIVFVIIGICLIGWLNNAWTKYALIVWIVQKSDTQPSGEEIAECKKFVLMHLLEDLRNPKV